MKNPVELIENKAISEPIKNNIETFDYGLWQQFRYYENDMAYCVYTEKQKANRHKRFRKLLKNIAKQMLSN